ncbi:putative ribosome quality control (RQC) complex YloA/Tae2 family protein [Bacillus thermophilus]|uniref:Rqc2 homolog RqcH n=1 Tax=Siminovitchia thermophila TaxID=1245522 RepID=A0ABS2R7I6_9BACI|nr:NFACT RNA binding domain-containing protein [Siminovitchia thermophila]MBM7715611.1 putative ribosome quality control (RQC) complex YloA/Tae2 family protein [Siminovitchia thermophila]
MAFDGLFTRAMAKELDEALTGGRVHKIYQPYKNEVMIIIRNKGKNVKLLVSAHPNYSRVQITEETTVNPEEPPMFCMILRKHLERATVQSVYQPGLERIIVIEMKGRNDLGDETIKQLKIEIMGRHSNIILVNKDTQKIIDSIKHIPSSLNSYRTILPGSTYVYPPPQEKEDPFKADKLDILKHIDFNAGKIDKQIVQRFAGISPVAAKEIVFRAGLVNPKTLPPVFLNIMEKLKLHQYDYSLTVTEHKSDFYLFPLKHIGDKHKSFTSLSEMLDHFYFGKAERDRVRQQTLDLERLMKNEKEKNEKKLIKLEATLEKAEKADELQLLGELLTANMHAVKKGMKEIEVINYYDENGGKLTIPLDPRKSPAENAQNYFKKYQKAKNSIQAVKEQMELAMEEIRYFDVLLQQLESASVKDIEEIREELIEGGYIRRKAKRGFKKKSDAKPLIEKYRSSDQTDILVGKNNKQNDYLTNKLARRDDIWLHTKDIPGSHVVIRSKEPSEQTLLEAAMLAAYFSKAKHSSSVPVDYTKVRHVHKPKGAKPGFVIYDHQETLYVTPDEEQVKAMRI